MKSTRELVLNFVKSKTGVEVDDNAFVFDDIGLNGLDAETFMIEFADFFKLDFSTFDINEYALSEYELGNFFLILYRGIFDRKRLRRKSFKVSHLYEVVERGRWFEPV